MTLSLSGDSSSKRQSEANPDVDPKLEEPVETSGDCTSQSCTETLMTSEDSSGEFVD